MLSRQRISAPQLPQATSGRRQRPTSRGTRASDDVQEASERKCRSKDHARAAAPFTRTRAPVHDAARRTPEPNRRGRSPAVPQRARRRLLQRRAQPSRPGRARPRSRADSSQRSPPSRDRRSHASTSSISAIENVCISKNSPSAIASGISSVRRSRISSAMRALLTITSTAGIRPPRRRGSNRWLTTPRRTPARMETDLRLLLRREELDHAPDRLGGVERVQRREDEMARLRGLQRDLSRLGVAELADQDDVGVLPEHAPERLPEALGVEADLALVDDALLVVVEHLDRILDGHDVLAARAVDLVEHRRERRGLPRAGRTRDEDEPALLGREPADAGRKVKLVESRNPVRDHAKSEGDRPALPEPVRRGSAEARRACTPGRARPSHRTARAARARGRSRERASPRARRRRARRDRSCARARRPCARQAAGPP